MGKMLAVVVAVAALVGAGCGEGGDERSAEPAPEPQATTEASRCVGVNVAALVTLEESLRGRRTLGRNSAVQSSDSFDGPPALADDAWFVTAEILPGPGLATWLMSDEAFRTGGGIVVGADAAARAASNAGDLVDLEVIGVDESSDGFAESFLCAGEQ